MIRKLNYRDQVRAHIIKMMRNGKLKSEDSISLAELARKLKVSVTPIREALSQLQYSRIIQAVPNRGFQIPPLNDREAKQLYTLLGTLEHLAVLQSTYSAKTIDRLRQLNDEFVKAEHALQRVNCDLNFHRALVDNCQNEYALQFIYDIKTRIFFYEIKFMEATTIGDLSNHQHFKIISALEAGDIERAANYTRDNWLVTLKKYQHKNQEKD